jgi:ABC-type bacteriocin/lantibiotic exporter with double-glycine peptidase domain
MKLLIKLYSPEEGQILIDNVDIKTIDTDYLRKNITYVNQNSRLFDRKVIDNIMYGCNNPEKCDQHLAFILKYKKIQQLFQGIDFKQKQSGALGENLSGGQRQIVNIISGLINPSKILILDEPTNALDPELKKEIIQIIKEFKKHKKGILIISHDRDLFPIFDENIKL